MQYMGHGMIVHHWRTNFQVLAGLAVTEDFDDNNFIPLVGMRSFHGRWYFKLTLPLEAKASYRMNEEFFLYGGAWISGAQYRVRSDTEGEFDVQVIDTRVGGGMYYWLIPDLKLTFEAGALLGNDAYEVKIDGVDGTRESDLENAGYVRFGLGLRLG